MKCREWHYGHFAEGELADLLVTLISDRGKMGDFSSVLSHVA